MTSSITKRSSLALLPVVALSTLAATAAAHESGGDHGSRSSRARVFTTTDAAQGNAVVAFSRDATGALAEVGSYPTGGEGTGKGLGSQGALAVAGEWLFAVNAGSNDISTFSLASGVPVLAGRTPSSGTKPVSLTVHDHLLYVLNAGDAGNVSGFWFDERGALFPIAGSTQPLSEANSGAVEVAFTPDGDELVVAEKVANVIETFALDRRGRARPAVSHPSSGDTPFGFDFGRNGELIISEAFGGVAGAAAVSSYAFARGGLQPVSASVPDHQSAACWLAVGEDGRFAFTANAGSGNVSAYRIARDGALSLVGSGVAASTGAGSHPIDLAFAAHDHLLYVLASATGVVHAFAVDGADLTPLGATGTLPPSASGLATR